MKSRQEDGREHPSCSCGTGFFLANHRRAASRRGKNVAAADALARAVFWTGRMRDSHNFRQQIFQRVRLRHDRRGSGGKYG